jgi:3-methylfumaryl-CoA hydratase
MIADAFDISLLQQWVGNSETVEAHIGARQADALAAALDHPLACAPGAPLPPLGHWIYFWGVAPQAELGVDGHPQRGGFLPPVPLPRRMWTPEFCCPVAD